jgi:hypothetical protein
LYILGKNHNFVGKVDPIMHSNEKLYFLSFCVEAYKMSHQMSGESVMALFDQKGVTQYLINNFEILHTQGERWLIDDIDEFIQDHNDTISRQ